MTPKRKSRAMQRINYDAIFAVANYYGWLEIPPVAHLTRAEYVKDLRAAAEARGLSFDAMYASGGWIMIKVEPGETGKEGEN